MCDVVIHKVFDIFGHFSTGFLDCGLKVGGSPYLVRRESTILNEVSVFAAVSCCSIFFGLRTFGFDVWSLPIQKEVCGEIAVLAGMVFGVSVEVDTAVLVALFCDDIVTGVEKGEDGCDAVMSGFGSDL